MRSIAPLLLILTVASPAAAWDFVGARPLGMGGAYRAIVTGNDAIMLNPAGMSMFKHYSFEAQYLVKPDWLTQGGEEEHIFNASVVDNQIAAFATGLSYSRVERGDNKKGNRYDMAFSLDITPNLMFGTNVKYISFDNAENESDIDAVTVDVGMLLRFDFGLHIGVVGYNLTNTADYLEHPISMAAAVMFAPFRSLELSFDWFINFQKPVEKNYEGLPRPLGKKETGNSYHFGVEYLVLGQFLVRAGYVIDKASAFDDEQYWSAGAGYVSKTVAIDFGYQGSVLNSWNKTFGVVIRLFM